MKLNQLEKNYLNRSISDLSERIKIKIELSDKEEKSKFVSRSESLHKCESNLRDKLDKLRRFPDLLNEIEKNRHQKIWRETKQNLWRMDSLI